MKNRLILLVAGAAILTALGAQASSNDPGETFEKKFFRHIGLPDRDGTEGGGVMVAIMEGHYNPQYQYSGKIVHTSPNMNPPPPTFEEITTPSFAEQTRSGDDTDGTRLLGDWSNFCRTNPTTNRQIGASSGDGTGELPVSGCVTTIGVKANSISQFLGEPQIVALSAHSKMLSKFFEDFFARLVAVGLIKDDAKGFDGGRKSNGDAMVNMFLYNDIALALHKASVYLEIDKLAGITFEGKLSSTVNAEAITQFLKKTAEDVKNKTEHGNDVTETFFKIASGACVKLYHPAEITAVVEDEEPRVVNFSSYAIPIKDPKPLTELLKPFESSGKLLIMGLLNDNLHYSESAYSSEILKLATDAHNRGFEVIACSAASVVDDELLGTVGNYITTDDTSLRVLRN